MCTLLSEAMKECSKNAFHELLERLVVFSFTLLQADHASVRFFFFVCLFVNFTHIVEMQTILDGFE